MPMGNKIKVYFLTVRNKKKTHMQLIENIITALK